MFWTREKLDAQHQRRFRKLVCHAAKKSPYYADLFARNRLNPETVPLEEIPPLTRQTLIEEFDRLVTDRAISRRRVKEFFVAEPDQRVLFDNRYFAIQSSGTSGMPAYMVYSPREWIRSCSLQSRLMPGLQVRRRIAFVGGINEHFTGVTLSRTGCRGLSRAFFDCRVIDHNLASETLVEELNRLQPHVLSTYAHTHRTLMAYVAVGELKIRPKYVICSGEVLSPQLRSLLEQTYQATVVDMYAATETLLLAGTTTADGMMLFEDDIRIEILPDHFLYTNLFNRTLPMIRYRINDVLEPCDTLRAGSPFRWIRRIVGRNEQNFEVINNRGIAETLGAMTLIVLPIPTVPGLQLVVVNPTHLIFRVLESHQASPAENAALLEEVRAGIHRWMVDKRLDKSVRCEVVGVPKLEIDPRSGKVKPILYGHTEAQRAA